MKSRTATLLIAILILAATPALASTQGTATNTISPTLAVNVTVQSAIQLTLAQNTGCAVGAGSGTDYAMNFGNVDALGINAGACGSKFVPATPGVSNAAYYSDYKLIPAFTSQSVSTNTIKAYVSTNFAKASLSAVYATSAPANIGALSALSISSAAPTTLVTNATSGTAVVSYIGVEIAPTNGAGLTGADSATITYTLTVQ